MYPGSKEDSRGNKRNKPPLNEGFWKFKELHTVNEVTGQSYVLDFCDIWNEWNWSHSIIWTIIFPLINACPCK